MKSRLPYLYLIGAFLHIALLAFLPSGEYLLAATKLTLMPLLMAYVYLHELKHESRASGRLLVLALFFSFLGDFFLLDLIDREGLFIFGLSSFLVTHLIYIYLFGKGKPLSALFKSSVTILLLAFILLWAGFITLKLYPALGDMQWPVLIYIVIISMMSITAVNRKAYVASFSFLAVFAGAILFMLSDMFIAVDKFLETFDYSRILVMSTYLCAQWLIVNGLLFEYQMHAEHE